MQKNRGLLSIFAGLGLLLLTVGCALMQQKSTHYEVWAADQNDDKIYILDPEGKTLKTIDGKTLGDAKRPHMLWGVPKDTYVYVTSTVSNSVTVLDGKDGAMKAVIPGVGKAPHAAQPSPAHPERVYVSNIGPQVAAPDGKPDRGETITEIVRRNGSKWEIARFLDLKAAPALADTNLYPSRRPRLRRVLERRSLSADDALQWRPGSDRPAGVEGGQGMGKERDRRKRMWFRCLSLGRGTLRDCRK